MKDGPIMARILKGVAVAAVSFVLLGSVATLWENPVFVRMTPAGNLEIVLLGAMSVLLGAYAAVRRPACSIHTAGTGGVLGFLGVACPVCNKILLIIFGGELLLTYYEPVRVYVAAAGVLVVAFAVWIEWTRRSEPVSVARNA